MRRIPSELKLMLRARGIILVMQVGFGTDRDAKRVALAITEVIQTFVYQKRKREILQGSSYSIVPYYILMGALEFQLYLIAKQRKITSLPLPLEEKLRNSNYDALKIHSPDTFNTNQISNICKTLIMITIGEHNEENREFESSTFRTGGSKIIQSITGHNLAN